MTRNKHQIEVQKRTYCPFTDGLQPELLRIGGLYIDPMNPTGPENLRFDYRWTDFRDRKRYEEHLHEQGYCFPDDIVSNFHKTFMHRSDKSFGIKATSAFNASHSREKSVETSLTGKAGRRIALRVPQRFMEEDVLTQPGAMRWLIDQATIIKSSLPFGNAQPTWKPPQVYLCTGLQMVKNGSYQTSENKASSTSVEAEGDPSAAAGAPPGSLAVGVNVAWGNGKGSETSYTFEGERIWAAEFSPLKVQYSSEADLEDNNRPRLVRRCEVLPIPNLDGGVRKYIQQEESSMESPHAIDIIMADNLAVVQHDDASGNTLDIDGNFADHFSGVNWTKYHKARNWLDVNSRKEKGVKVNTVDTGDAIVGAARS